MFELDTTSTIFFISLGLLLASSLAAQKYWRFGSLGVLAFFFFLFINGLVEQPSAHIRGFELSLSVEILGAIFVILLIDMRQLYLLITLTVLVVLAPLVIPLFPASSHEYLYSLHIECLGALLIRNLTRLIGHCLYYAARASNSIGDTYPKLECNRIGL